MPIFLNNKLLFIHIPKTGGTSIEKFIEDNGDVMAFYTFSGSIFVNSHTPQHCTYKEYESFNFLKSGMRIFTIVRNPEERVISEFFYIHKYRPDIRKYFKNFEEYLQLFLSYENLTLFDNHNLSQYDYLKNQKGEIDMKIKIFKFFDHKEIENYLGMKGLSTYSKYKTEKNGFLPTRDQSDKIKDFYALDYQLFKF